MTERFKPTKHKNPVKAIRLNCLECVGGSPKLVAECASKDCQLYPFRFGVNPYNSRTGRKLKGEAKEKARRIAIGNLSKIGVAPN